MEREVLLNRACINCADFVRQLSCYRAIKKYEQVLSQNFWIYVYNNSIDMAVIDWCHIFGNDNDDLHWKNIEDDYDKFRAELCAYLELSMDEWIEYRKSVKEHRNKDVAHIEVKPTYDIPVLDKGLEAVCFFYDRIVPELKSISDKYTTYPDRLNEYYDKLLEQQIKFVDTAYKATSKFEEEVF